MKRCVLGSVLAAVLCIGCGAAAQKQLRARAQADLDCPEAALTLTKIDARTQQVTGCDQRAMYITTCTSDSFRPGCAWILNSHSGANTTATAESVAESSASSGQHPLARIDEGRAKDGSKELRLFLRNNRSWMLYVNATPSTDAQVATLVWLVPRTHGPKECEIKFVADGSRVELGAETNLVERTSTFDYRSSLSYASLMQIAKSSRVVGRLCDLEITLSEAQLEKTRELVVRIREEQAWDEEPTRTDEPDAAVPIEL